MTTPDPDILIGIDGGGTQCRFALLRGGERIEHRGGSANVHSDFDRAVATLKDGLAALADKAGLADLRSARAYLGLAGVTGPEAASRVAEALPIHRIAVSDDRITAVVGALGARNGAVMGIGTGSFLARRAGGRVRLMGGWGLVLGDEASGAYLGRRALQRALHVLDGLAEATPFTDAIHARFESSPVGLLRFARDASAAEFATLAPMILDAARAGDIIAWEILREGADYILHGLNRLGWTPGEVLCPIGGLAPHYAGFLPADVTASFAEPAGSALDGALTLAAGVET